MPLKVFGRALNDQALVAISGVALVALAVAQLRRMGGPAVTASAPSGPTYQDLLNAVTTGSKASSAGFSAGADLAGAGFSAGADLARSGLSAGRVIATEGISAGAQVANRSLDLAGKTTDAIARALDAQAVALTDVATTAVNANARISTAPVQRVAPPPQAFGGPPDAPRPTPTPAVAPVFAPVRGVPGVINVGDDAPPPAPPSSPKFNALDVRPQPGAFDPAHPVYSASTGFWSGGVFPPY